jgi:hypothetical protein
VNDDILSRFKYLYLSYHRFGQKEAKRGRNVRRRIEFFRKRREKRETYFQGEDGYKRDKERRVCFVKSEKFRKSFSRKRKEENKNPHTRTRLYDFK